MIFMKNRYSTKKILLVNICLILISVFCFCSPSLSMANEEEELFLVAQKAFEDGFYDVAIRYIEQYINEYPETEKYVQIQLLLGQCYFFQNQYLKAFNIFQHLLSYSEYKDATLFWLGETYFKGSDYKEAEKYYKQLINVYPKSIYVPQAYYSLGWTMYEQDNFEKAKNVFLNQIKQYPSHRLSEDAMFKTGECEHNLGVYKNSILFFKKYIQRYPKSPRIAKAHFYVAEAHYYMDEFLQAATYYAKAADIAYDKQLIYTAKVSMGWSYLKIEKFDLSKKYFDEAQKIAKENGILSDDIYFGQANLYSSMGDNDKALTFYSDLIKLFPESQRLSDAYLGSANILYTNKKYNEAISVYKQIIEKYSDDSTQQEIIEKAHYGIAWAYLKLGEPDLSIQSFRDIMNKTESKIVKVSALMQIGDAYHDINEFYKAIPIYDQILKDYPDSIYADYVQFRQAIALLKLNRLEAATLSFKSLKANFPNSKYLNDVEYYLGVAYFKKGDWYLSVKHSSNYLESLPQSNSFSAESNYILGLSYVNLKEYKKALVVFEHIIDTFDEHKTMVRNSHFNIAKCFYKSDDVDNAINKFIMIYEAYPDSEEAQESLLWLGDHYIEKLDWENAIKYYKQFADKYPGSKKTNVVNYQLGQSFQAMGQIDKALNYYKLITNTDNQVLYAKAKLAVANIFSEDLDMQTALDTYYNIVKNVPAFKRDAYMKIAEIHEQQKDYVQARDAYANALGSAKSLSKISSVELQFRIADMSEVLNEYNKAVEEYLKLSYLYPKQKDWVIKSYLRIARIFEDTEEWEDARLIYKKIIEYETKEAKYAQERLEWIDSNTINK